MPETVVVRHRASAVDRRSPRWLGDVRSTPKITDVELHHFSPDVDPADVATHLRRWGYAIVDDVADAEIDIIGEKKGDHTQRGEQECRWYQDSVGNR